MGDQYEAIGNIGGEAAPPPITPIAPPIAPPPVQLPRPPAPPPPPAVSPKIPSTSPGGKRKSKTESTRLLSNQSPVPANTEQTDQGPNTFDDKQKTEDVENPAAKRNATGRKNYSGGQIACIILWALFLILVGLALTIIAILLPMIVGKFIEGATQEARNAYESNS